MFVPAFTNPNANARSRFGNHSDNVLVAAGKFGDSATPSAARAIPKLHGPRANACAIEATLHVVNAIANPIFTPITSSNAPHTNCPPAYASANADCIYPY